MTASSSSRLRSAAGSDRPLTAASENRPVTSRQADVLRSTMPSSMKMTIQGTNTQISTERLANAEQSRNHAMTGANQIALVTSTQTISSQICRNGNGPNSNSPGEPPPIITTSVARTNNTICVATMIAAVTSGAASIAVISFETTVSVSVTGIDRQNRMLLSLRSA